MKLMDYVTSVKVENKGSAARDHLANERTFLAWLRTSLAFTTIGVALTQFFRLALHEESTTSPKSSLGDRFVQRSSSALGGLFVATGIVTLVFGMFRYYTIQSWLQQGRFPASRGLVAMSFLLTISLVVIAFGLLLYIETSTINT